MWGSVCKLKLFSFSQKKDRHDSISKFILSLENSIIESINEHRSKNNIITVNRESVLDSASSYHNEYLKVLNGGNSKSFGIVHFESIKIDNLTYTGTNKILEMPKDRVLKFDKELGKVERSMSRFGGKMQNIGTTLTQSLTLPIIALGAASSCYLFSRRAEAQREGLI